MKHMLSWAATAILFAAAGGVCAWAIFKESDHQTEEEKTAEHEPEPQVAHDEAGHVVVILDEAARQRAGIEVTKTEATSRQPETIAYGLLAEDPALSFTLRAPIDGVLRRDNAHPWPKLGDHLNENTPIGRLEPRLAPVERADLTGRLNDARAQVQETSAAMAALKSSYENKRELNAKNKIISDQELQDVEAKMKGEEARLQAALVNVRNLESYLGPSSRPTDDFPLIVGMAGQIVELMAREAEAVQNGQAILRVARFDRLVARVSLPAGHLLKDPPSRGYLIMAGHEDTPLEAESISPVVDADTVTGGQAFLVTISNKGLPLQPGMAVTAHLPVAGDPLQGVIVPRSAVIRFVGKTWVYVPAADDRFSRREIQLEIPAAEGWFVRGVKPGESVVVSGAQSLLSQELKLQMVGGEEEE